MKWNKGNAFLFILGSSAGKVGLALTQVFKLTSFVELAVRKWTFLENNMISVERAIEYTAAKQERKEGKVIMNWPIEGHIRFENIVLCYEGSKTPILKGIHFNVKPKEKIGIVGRTGAGKSSIISILYRMYEYDGMVMIDGVDIKTLSLEVLRLVYLGLNNIKKFEPTSIVVYIRFKGIYYDTLLLVLVTHNHYYHQVLK